MCIQVEVVGCIVENYITFGCYGDVSGCHGDVCIQVEVVGCIVENYITFEENCTTC